MSKKWIKFNLVRTIGNELKYMEEAVRNGHIAGDGPFTVKCQDFLRKELNVPKVLLTTSGTHALEMAAMLLDVQPGDEIIVPSFTFVSTANAFVLRGAKPVFIEIRPDTLNMDESKLESLITEKTKAIIPVHYAGVGCEMDRISDIADRYSIPVIEDNAHGLFGKYKGEHLGSFGPMATLSFHETKNFSSGEGGALIINDKRLIKRAEVIREKGTNRAQFFRGEVDKYTWRDVGSSYLPSDILAAFLLGQLEKKGFVQKKRKQIWDFYYSHLSDWAEKNRVKMPYIPSNCEQSYHLFYILLPSLESRTKLISYLKDKGVLSVFHYQPLHTSPMGRKFGYERGDFPVTEDISERLLRLPFYNTLGEEDLEEVSRVISDFNV